MQKVNRSTLLTIPAPPRTKTWNPIPHFEILNAMAGASRSLDLGDPRQERYEISDDGHKLFATWCFGSGPIIPVVGFRNSTDKSLAFGIASGANVCVCSNMSFFGDYINFRKHTGDFDLQEAYSFATASLTATIDRSTRGIEWIENLRHVSVSTITAKAFNFDLIHYGIIPYKFFPKWSKCFMEEMALQAGAAASMYVYYNSVTRFLKQYDLDETHHRTEKLRTVVNGFIS